MQPNWLPGGKKSHLGGLTQKVENNQGTIATMCLHKIWTKKQSSAELFLIHPKSAAFIWFSSCCQNYCCLYHFSAFTFSSWTYVTFAFSTPFICLQGVAKWTPENLKKAKLIEKRVYFPRILWYWFSDWISPAVKTSELLSAQFQLYLNFFDAIYVSHQYNSWLSLWFLQF